MNDKDMGGQLSRQIIVFSVLLASIIIAGIVLGFMSLKTRSIWLGAALHIAVAVTMDLLALWRLGHFG